MSRRRDRRPFLLAGACLALVVGLLPVVLPLLSAGLAGDDAGCVATTPVERSARPDAPATTSAAPLFAVAAAATASTPIAIAGVPAPARPDAPGAAGSDACRRL